MTKYFIVRNIFQMLMSAEGLMAYAAMAGVSTQ